MSRRPLCSGSHDWVLVRGGTSYRCTKCPDVFPCRYQCGHVDCQEERGKPSKCSVCSKSVELDDQFHHGNRRMYVAHKACQNQIAAESEESPDSLPIAQEG